MKKFFLFIFSIIFMSPNLYAAYGDPVGVDLFKKDVKSAVVRSIILPGWGEFYLQRPNVGYLCSIGAITGFLGAGFCYYKAEEAYDNYKSVGIKNGNDYNTYIDYTNYMYYSLGIAISFWIYGIVDTYIYGVKKFNKKEDSASVKIDLYKNAIAYSLKF